MVAINKNLEALWRNNNAGTNRLRTICLEGSARSGKTWAWIEYLINLCSQYPHLVCSVFRHDASTHEEAALRDFKSIMLMAYKNIWDAGKWNGTLKCFTFSNGSIIEFNGTNDPAKLHGPERDIAVFNETMEITYEAFRQIQSRTRLMTIMDWNPSHAKHWVFSRVLKRNVDEGAPEVLYIHSTYKDNPHLAQKIIDEIESYEPTEANDARGTSDSYMWDVYGLGKRAKREGAIFRDYHICSLEEWAETRGNWQRHGYGLDFGYANDPCALVECGLYGSRLYLRELMYETGLITTRSHAKPSTPCIETNLRMLGIKDWEKIVADCARPEQIAELGKEGFNVTACSKVKDSIVGGIDLMKSFSPIMVHPNSMNMQLELDQYAWKKKPTGEQTDVPDDDYNHLIDGARYWCLDELPRLMGERVGSVRSRRAGGLKSFRQ